MMNKLPTILLCVNFITVLFPQPGYIHPDEFFQCSEIVAGDLLEVQHVRAWEFNASAPVRSIVFPYLLTGPSLALLKWMNSTGISSLQISAVKVVMATRLPLAFFSVAGYLATSRLAEFCGAEKYLSTVLWCSSYVTWTYFTRTFSNTVEAVLLAVVLLLVFSHTPSVNHCMAQENRKENKKSKHSESGTRMQESLKTAPVKEKSVPEGTTVKEGGGRAEVETEENKKAKLVRETKDSGFTAQEMAQFENTVRNWTAILLGVVVTGGFFNRPTFLLFSGLPVFYWFIYSKKSSIVPSIFSIILFGFGAAATFCVFVLIDTVYFDSSFYDFVLNGLDDLIKSNFSLSSLPLFLKSLMSKLVITPWNFIQYNTQTENLQEHGLHPRYTHLLLNTPLLLGPLVLPLLITCVSTLVSLLQGSVTSQRRAVLWLMLMVLVPLAGLSVFPHQEPRFLVPQLPFLVVLGGLFISTIPETRLTFVAMWIVFNLVLNLIYGYMHQAALIPALSLYQQKLATAKHYGTNHAIFYKTYPPPQHLLLLPENQHQQQVNVHDLAGAPLDALIKTVGEKRALCGQSRERCSVYVFMPATVSARALELFEASNYQVSSTSICPHLSMEAPPRLTAWWRRRISLDELVMDLCLNVVKLT